MKTQHTPGPWVARNTGTSIGVFGRNGTEQVHCDRNTPQQEANARLIASAPQLLEALEGVMEFWVYGTPVHSAAEVISHARVAIAKAKGKTL